LVAWKDFPEVSLGFIRHQVNILMSANFGKCYVADHTSWVCYTGCMNLDYDEQKEYLWNPSLRTALVYSIAPLPNTSEGLFSLV